MHRDGRHAKREGHLLLPLLVCLLPLLRPCAPALAEEISGTYVGSAGKAAFLVQVVVQGHGNLIGRFEQLVLHPDGTVNDTNAVIAGAIDGTTVVVTVKPNQLSPTEIALSGTIDGKVLHLAGDGASLYLVKSTEADFDNRVNTLEQESKHIISARQREVVEQQNAKAAAALLTNVQQLNDHIADFITKAATLSSKLPLYADAFHKITERMTAALSRERSIYGAGRAGVARSQISVAINQAAVQANQLHIQVNLANQSFNLRSDELTTSLGRNSQACRTFTPLNQSGVAQINYADLDSACQRLSEASKPFYDDVARLRSTFARVEATWNEERRQQEVIISASNAATR